MFSDEYLLIQEVARIQAERKRLYALHADPLFFQVQDGGVNKDVWLAEKEAIKAANPYPQAWIDMQPAPTFEERLAAARASATLTRLEFFLGLDAIGIYDTIMTAELPRAARIELETATYFDRTRPTLVEVAHSLGVTDEQLDALFNVEVTP